LQVSRPRKPGQRHPLARGPHRARAIETAEKGN
jgi:hypothetical protein